MAPDRPCNGDGAHAPRPAVRAARLLPLVVLACLSACRPAPQAPAPVPDIAPARAPAMVDPVAAPATAARVDPGDAALAQRVAARLGQALGAPAAGTLRVRVQGGAVRVDPLPGATARAADVQAALRGVPGIRALDTAALP